MEYHNALEHAIGVNATSESVRIVRLFNKTPKSPRMQKLSIVFACIDQIMDISPAEFVDFMCACD